MKNEYGIVGVAHIGLPTNDLKKTIEFYKSLGFEVILETYNEKAKEKVAFLQIQNYCIESFENGQAVMADGAYQHVALDVRDIEEMYKKICENGFEVILETYNEKAKEKVAFLQIQNYCIESFENGQAVMADGAYQHVALDVRDIEEMYKKICENGYEVITDGIEQLPFWDNGVKFFMIKGPNEERIEFCQKL